jgi:hypothetical protein
MDELIRSCVVASIKTALEDSLSFAREQCPRDFDPMELVVEAVGRNRLMAWLKTHPPS